MLYKLSYEATPWEQGQFIEIISPVNCFICTSHGFDLVVQANFERDLYMIMTIHRQALNN